MVDAIVKAIVATAAATILIAAICFYFFYRYVVAKEKRFDSGSSFQREEETMSDTREFGKRGSEALRGVLVEESDLEVVYLRRLEGGQVRSCVSTVWFNPMLNEEKRVDYDWDHKIKHEKPEPVNDVSPCHLPKVVPEDIASLPLPCIVKQAEEKPLQIPAAPPLPPTRLTPVRTPPPLSKPSPPPSQPPPLVVKMPPTQSMPPPPPLSQPSPPVVKMPPSQSMPPPPPPPPPPILAVPRKIATRPLPPPILQARKAIFPSALKPPRGRANASGKSAEAQVGETSKEKGEVETKMKPFYWDKVNTSGADHSLVWNEINDGSFRFDDELMEALFGYNAKKRKPAQENSDQPASSNPTQFSILDPRKSQNTAIVLKSLQVSRKEIVDALLEGRGLSADTLEKLTTRSPTKEEVAKILNFGGNPTKLSAAESFLHHILKAVPSAFICINAMLFRSNYDPEVLHLKECLQTLELGCKELRARGIFFKLLEAILKAGNRMNAGTSRGDAQGFNLSALRKLSYVKSTDGNTTLLHFVVEQVVRSEGKRCSISTRNHKRLGSDQDCCTSNVTIAKEERDKEYMILGLPVLGGLNTDFTNVKKSATIDYESLRNMIPNLTARVTEIRQLVTQCDESRSGGFVKEMKGFLEECEGELKVVREEQNRVMELVKRTTDFYQAGSSSSKDKGAQPLQIFGFVKDFLDMVDQACIDLTRKLQKKSNSKSVLGLLPSSPPLSPTTRTHSCFTSDKLRSSASSSDSEDDF